MNFKVTDLVDRTLDVIPSTDMADGLILDAVRDVRLLQEPGLQNRTIRAKRGDHVGNRPGRLTVTPHGSDPRVRRSTGSCCWRIMSTERIQKRLASVLAWRVPGTPRRRHRRHWKSSRCRKIPMRRLRKRVRLVLEKDRFVNAEAHPRER